MMGRCPTPPPPTLPRTVNARTVAERLPRLIDRRGIADELGVTKAAAERIMRQLPKVHIAGLRKVYVKRDDVRRLIEQGTRS